jgi:hypothetical protein
MRALLRRLLDFLAGSFDSRANIINSIVRGAASAFHRTTRTAAADNSQRQNGQGEDRFHDEEYNVRAQDFNRLGLRVAAEPCS